MEEERINLLYNQLETAELYGNLPLIEKLEQELIILLSKEND